MQQFRRQRRWPRRRLLLQRLLPFRVLPRHAANGRQVSRPRDKTSEAAPGFPPSSGRRARAGRTLSSSFVRSFVLATPVTPGWKGGIGLPKGSQAMWSPVSLLTTCVVPTTWFSQITGCCRRPLFGDLRRWVTNAGQAVGGMDPGSGQAGRAHRCCNRSLGGRTNERSSLSYQHDKYKYLIGHRSSESWAGRRGGVGGVCVCVSRRSLVTCTQTDHQRRHRRGAGSRF